MLDVRVTQSLDLGEVFCRSLFAFLSLLVLPLYCMSFFELRLLVTPLVISHLQVVSSNYGNSFSDSCDRTVVFTGNFGFLHQ